MEQVTAESLELARSSLASTIRKNEKVYATLSQKTPPRTGQMDLVARNLQNLRVYLALVEAAQGGAAPHAPAADLEAVSFLPHLLPLSNTAIQRCLLLK